MDNYKQYLSGLQVDVDMASFTKCWPEWRDIDYTPDYNKLYFIIDGEGWIKVGDEEFYPKPGQLILMPSGKKQSFSAINENTFTKYWCHFTARVGDRPLFDVLKLPLYIDVSDADKVESLFKDLTACYKGTAFSDAIRLKALLLEILAYYISSASDTGTIEFSFSEQSAKIKCVMDFIDSHLSEEITVEMLAEILHFHPNYFIRFFKAYTGLSPIHYINSVRLRRVKELLLYSDRKIKEIALDTGFRDISYMSRMFRRLSGFTPSQFRNLR